MVIANEVEGIVRWLTRPECYPNRPDRVEHMETHISHVFLAGSYVYKLKKPVKYDFLDFSTVETREHACREEVRLNRRLAPETYVDIVPVTLAASGEFRLGGAGKIVDWLVQMLRLQEHFALQWLGIAAPGTEWRRVLDYSRQCLQRTYENTEVAVNLVVREEIGTELIAEPKLQKLFDPLAASAGNWKRVTTG